MNIIGNNNSTKRLKRILALIVYCLSGTLLTLINKLAVIILPLTNLLLVLQNGLAVILLIIASRFFRQTFGSLPSLNLTILQLWMPLVLLFVLMLTSSLLSLTYVSVPTVIVMRNLTTLFVAILEYIILNHKINGFSAITLVFMFLGAILYAKHDLTFNIPGYICLCINILSTSIYQIYIKKLTHLPIFENIGSIGMSYYNNLISLPVFFICALMMGELRILLSKFDLKSLFEIKSISLLLFSGLLGFLLSVSAFALNKLISATSMMVANNVNKFSIIILSEIFVQSTLDIMTSIGAISVLLLGWLYSQTVKLPSKKLFMITAIIFTLISALLEYKHIYTGMRDIDDRNQVISTNRNTILLNKLLSNDNQIINVISENDGDEIYGSYLPTSRLNDGSSRKRPGIFIKNLTEFQLPKTCRRKNSSIWKICKPRYCVPDTTKLKLNYPRRTSFNEKTSDFINHVLEIAWGTHPPSVDLYVRSGCNGIMEMRYLLESIEIFWPRFLGSIIIILDVGNEKILKYFLPIKPTHHYVIGFEYTPCLPGRVFNQYSYLNLDRHSIADYIVTIDSDCIFHSPVTPDLIFRQGKVILASSRTFQRDLWKKPLESVMGIGMYDGHYMVTQPVTFSRSTFSAFRQWFYNSKGKCYEDHLSQLSSDNYPFYCWMCQLGTYLERGNPEQIEYEKYWFLDLDNNTIEPMIRYSIHVTYESYDTERCEEVECYEKSANEIIRQGLCRAFGSSIFHFCNNYFAHFDYIYNVTFLYARTDIQAADQNARITAINDYLERLLNITIIALYRSIKSQLNF